MPDKAYENAKARRDELARTINEAQQRMDAMRGELHGIDTFLEQWRKFAGVEAPTAQPSPLSQGSVYRRERPHRNSKKEEVAQAAREILNAEGRPLPRTELYKRLVDRGLVIEGSDPEMVLSTMLWRMSGQIVRLPKGYWPTDVPYPEGGYIPGEQSPAAITTANTPVDEIAPSE
jgi:hypothetical protein